MKSNANPMWVCYLWTRALIGTPDFVLDLMQVCNSPPIIIFQERSTYMNVTLNAGWGALLIPTPVVGVPYHRLPSVGHGWRGHVNRRRSIP